MTMPKAVNPETGEVIEFKDGQWMPAGVDQTTGAPAQVRAAVGPEYRGPDDRLATLRNFYPDAQMFGDGNFIFTEDGKTRLYNPKGVDVGDLAEYGRIIPEMLGGAVGGTIAAATAAPTGMLAAPVAVPVGIGLGAAAGGGFYDRLFEFLGGRVDTRGLPERAVEAVTDVTLNAAGQKVVPAVASGVKRVVGAVRNRLAGESPEVLLESYKAANLPLQGAAGSIASSKPVQGLENALRQLPTSARTMHEAADMTMNAVTRYHDEVARMAGSPETGQRIGETIQAGSKAAGNRFALRISELENKMWDAVGRQTPTNLDSTRSLVESMQAEMARAPQTLTYLRPAIREGEKILADAEAAGGQVPFDVLRKFRTHIGDLVKRPDVSGYVGAEAGQVNRLYGALSEDLKATADAAGPEARKALDLYNRYARANLREGGNLEFLNKIGNLLPDNIIGKLTSAGKKGATDIARLRNNLLPEEWDDVASTVIHRMGMANPGAQDAAGEVFSPATFLTNWNRLAPEARFALFGGNRYVPLRNELDRLAKISASIKDTASMANPSKTAQGNFYIQLAQGGLPAAGALAGGVEGAVAGAAVSYGIPYATAKLMTSPKFVRWLANGMLIKPTNFNGQVAHLGRLALVAEEEPKVKAEIYQFLQSLRTPSAQSQGSATTQEAPRTE